MATFNNTRLTSTRRTGFSGWASWGSTRAWASPSVAGRNKTAKTRNDKTNRLTITSSLYVMWQLRRACDSPGDFQSVSLPGCARKCFPSFSCWWFSSFILLVSLKVKHGLLTGNDGAFWQGENLALAQLLACLAHGPRNRRPVFQVAGKQLLHHAMCQLRNQPVQHHRRVAQFVCQA